MRTNRYNQQLVCEFVTHTEQVNMSERPALLFIIVLSLWCGVFCKTKTAWVVDDHGCLTPEKQAGFCTELNTCETVNYLIGNRDYFSDGVQDILQDFACGVDDYGLIKVCCPYKPLVLESNTIIDHTNHRNAILLPENCGKTRAWGFLNGNEANLFEFGWSVLLKYRKTGNPLVCGGSLINEKYILTSASCVRNKYQLIGARIGEQNVKTFTDCTQEYSAGKIVEICGPPPQDFVLSAEDFIVHPKFDPKTLANNLALIRLKSTVNLTAESVSIICLPITSEDKQHNDSKYTAIGWGVTENGLHSPTLLKVLTKKIEGDQCISTYTNRIGNIFIDQICVSGSEEKNYCAEDLGGPLMGYKSKDSKLKTIQYGVLSIRPSNCVSANVPTAYTSTIPHIGWILDNLRP